MNFVEHGAVYVDRFGQPKTSPWVQIERVARFAALRALRELSLHGSVVAVSGRRGRFWSVVLVPVRSRRRQHRLHLGAREFVDLSIGPSEVSPIPFDRYLALYLEHAGWFDSSSWAFGYFDTGVDDREPMELALAVPGFSRRSR